MTFAFDTGEDTRRPSADGLSYSLQAVQCIRDRVTDNLPLDATQAERDAALVLYCKSIVYAVKTPAAIARNGLTALNACREITDRDPRLFFDLLSEIHGRLDAAL